MSAIGQRLIEIVRAKAAENPDFIYESPGGPAGSCAYVHQGQPSCLLGHALWGVGVIDANLPRGLNEESFDNVATVLALKLDAAEVSWLDNVQYYQDDNFSWGDSIKRADVLKREAELEL